MKHIESLKPRSLKRIQTQAQTLAKDAYTSEVRGERDFKGELRDLVYRARELEPSLEGKLAGRVITEHYFAALIALWASTGAHDAIAERAAQHVGLGTMQREYKEALDGKTDN
jgi:hypothetical protein